MRIRNILNSIKYLPHYNILLQKLHNSICLNYFSLRRRLCVGMLAQFGLEYSCAVKN